MLTMEGRQQRDRRTTKCRRKKRRSIHEEREGGDKSQAEMQTEVEKHERVTEGEKEQKMDTV